jgi:hypothetical protein
MKSQVFSFRYLAIIAFLLIYPFILKGQFFEGYSDGPYFFYKKDDIIVRWVERSKPFKKKFTAEELNIGEIQMVKPFNIPLDVLRKRPNEEESEPFEFNDVKKIAAISDIHGQYELMLKLFKAHNIINDDEHWTFGDGHLVIVGDIMDRGDKVTEILWFIVKLEQEALAAGGRVHLLLGNHELMVLKNDVRYIHPKYKFSSSKMDLEYAELFSEDTFLGSWLRSKPIYLTVNDVAFVHGGLHHDFFEMGIPINELNEFFKKTIIDQSEADIQSDSTALWLYADNGPLWYRGYAMKDSLTQQDLTTILKGIDKKHIVVGHTSLPEIVSIFKNKVILIDSSIKLGQGGEMLLIENNRFFKANDKGEKSQIEPIF